jgi:hypothetical protein
MNDYRNKPSRDCTPTDNPAAQPKPPVDDCHTCGDLPTTTPPTLPDPGKCPDPPSNCKCPKPPTNTKNCLEKAIDKVSKRIVQAGKASDFKTELTNRLGAATKAAQDYTQDQYQKLLTRWQDEDRAIVELLRKLTCAVPCWLCLIECYVCPILNTLRDAEQRLYGNGTLPSSVNNLLDLQYWLTRDKAAKDATVTRVKAVMDAWASPAKTIDGVLTVNTNLITNCNSNLGTSPGGVVFDVFLTLIPKHLAIAPPAVDPSTTTGIDKKYTVFCGCDVGKPDDCCGPDVGILSFRQRTIGPPLPYLVTPGDLFSVICCLVEKRYHPAQDAATDAAAQVTAVNDEITRYQTQLTNGVQSFPADGKNAIPAQPQCCDCDYDAQKPKY